MVRRRHRVELRIPCWRPDGDHYVADKALLEAAIRDGGLAENEIAVRMGHGYPLLAAALQGVRLTQYEAAHVEFGIKDWPALQRPTTTQSGPLDLPPPEA